jgi:type IV secretory pathway TraG/TraD family ATPase VirD4
MSKRTRNVSGKGLLGARSVSEGEQEFARPLVTPDEVMRLPFEDAILTVGGVPAYRARKIMYYLDDRFAPRVKEGEKKRPDSPRQQRAELLRGRAPSEWQTHAPSAPAAAAATSIPAPAAAAAPITPPDPSIPPDVPGAAWSHFFPGSQDEDAPVAEDGQSSETAPTPRPGSLPL